MSTVRGEKRLVPVGIDDGETVGCPVGPVLGSTLGTLLGTRVGSPEGISEELLFGPPLGLLIVLVEGPLLGRDDGLLLGPLVGASKGTADGDAVGNRVGAPDGLRLGPPSANWKGRYLVYQTDQLWGYGLAEQLGLHWSRPLVHHLGSRLGPSIRPSRGLMWDHLMASSRGPYWAFRLDWCWVLLTAGWTA
jgi:hypothetical protein